MPTAVQKRCSVCGRDVSAVKRVKDTSNRYYCQQCYTAATATASSLPATATTPKSAAEPNTSPVPPAPSRPPTTAGSAQSTAVAAEAVFAPPDRYARSPILKHLRVIGAKLGRRPAVNRRQANVLVVVKWLGLGLPVIIAYTVLLLGTRLLPTPEYRDGPLGLVVLVGGLCLICLVPASIALAGRAVVLIFATRAAWVRVAAALTILALVTGSVFAWPRLTEVYDVLSTSSKTNMSFTDLDNQFGAGVLTSNPGQLAKTTQQVQAEAAGLLGHGVSGTGVVADVQDGQVLLLMRRSSLKNEIAMIPAWWDQWRMEGLSRGDVVEFSGPVAGYGDPYPFTVVHATIRTVRKLSPDDAKSLLPE